MSIMRGQQARSFGTRRSTPPDMEPAVTAAAAEQIADGINDSVAGGVDQSSWALSDHLSKTDALKPQFARNPGYDRNQMVKIYQAMGQQPIGLEDSNGRFRVFQKRGDETMDQALLGFSKGLSGMTAPDQQIVDSNTQKLLAQISEVFNVAPDSVEALNYLKKIASQNDALAHVVYRQRLADADLLVRAAQQDPAVRRLVLDYIGTESDGAAAPSAPPPSVAPAGGGGGAQPPKNPPPNGGETDWWAESLPFLESTGLTRAHAGYALGGTAAVGGGLMLAAALADRGEQQADPAAYAAYQQQVHSY